MANFSVAIYSARSIREMAIAKLEGAKTGDRTIDREIDRIISSSLVDQLWIDDSHIDAKHGKDVFHSDHTTVTLMQARIEIFEREIHALERIIARKTARGQDASKEEARLAAIEVALPVFTDVVDDLARADRLLATVAIGDARDAEVQNPKFQRIVDLEIERAEKELSEAYQELEKGRLAEAIKDFEKAWQHAQLAIEFANKAE